MRVLKGVRSKRCWQLTDLALRRLPWFRKVIAVGAAVIIRPFAGERVDSELLCGDGFDSDDGTPHHFRLDCAGEPPARPLRLRHRPDRRQLDSRGGDAQRRRVGPPMRDKAT